MFWLIFTIPNDLITKKCTEFLQAAGQIVLHQFVENHLSLEKIIALIRENKPDRIVISMTMSQDSSLFKKMDDHLLLPLFVGQATNQLFSRIPVLLLNISTSDSNLEIIQDATDQLILIHPNIINAKLLNPINDDNINLDYFRTNWHENPEQRHRLAILSDILPILLALTHDGQVNGQINICNKETISLQSVEKLNSGQARVNQIQTETDDFTDKFEEWSQHKIMPETRQLYQIPFVVPTLSKSLESFFKKDLFDTDSNKTKVILVTGGCGFIGSTFINYWSKINPNDKIINIDRLDPVANIDNIENPNSSNYSLIVADINNTDIVLHLMNQYCITHIVHFAVQAHVDNSFGNSITFTESNVYGTHSVLEASRIYGKIQKFLHISTDEVYGETPPGCQQEIFLLNPLNPYAATIAAAEFLVKSYGESFKLPYAIIRLCNVYGPRQHIEKVIPRFIQNITDGKKLTIEGDGKQIRHYLYVDDVVRAIELIFYKGKTKFIYNVGTSHAVSVLDLACLVQQKLKPDANLDDILTYVKPRSFMEKRYHAGTTSGAIKALGWKEEVNFDEGLDKTIQWLKTHPNYWKKS